MPATLREALATPVARSLDALARATGRSPAQLLPELRRLQEQHTVTVLRAQDASGRIVERYVPADKLQHARPEPGEMLILDTRPDGSFTFRLNECEALRPAPPGRTALREQAIGDADGFIATTSSFDPAREAAKLFGGPDDFDARVTTHTAAATLFGETEPTVLHPLRAAAMASFLGEEIEEPLRESAPRPTPRPTPSREQRRDRADALFGDTDRWIDATEILFAEFDTDPDPGTAWLAEQFAHDVAE